jgi:hypothetical protein
MADDFDKMAAEAEAALGTGGTDSGAPGEGAQTIEPAAPQVTNSQAISMAFIAGREFFCSITKLKSPAVALPDARCGQLGALWGPVCDKRGINLAELLGDYELEFFALMGTMAILGEVRTAVQAEIAALKAAEKKPEPAAADGPQA